jgi:AcrR family transcriptional regulator
MPRTTSARNDAIRTAVRLFRIQGYAATGLTQILEESGAPKGSFYFHFPGGKEELALEALDVYGREVEAGIRRLGEAYRGDAAGFVRALCEGAAEEMRRSDWHLGCAAQVLASELAPDNARATAAVNAVFAGWAAAITEVLRSGGLVGKLADRRAWALLSGLEGARTLARAGRTAVPFLAVAEQFAPA